MKKSKAKDHSYTLERRLSLWIQGEFDPIMSDCGEIQRKLIKSNLRKEDNIAKVFSRLLRQGKVRVAMRFLIEEGQGNLLKIFDDVLDEHKPGSHDSISISIRAKQKAKQRNQVKPAT